MNTLNIRKTCLALSTVGLLTGAATGWAAQPPSSANESAPATTGSATTPTQSPGRAGTNVMPDKNPAGANESQPATTGRASTPTAGQGRSGLPPSTEPMNRLPNTPSSVSESAPARTGKAKVPTANVTKMWGTADRNRDGYIDRSEFERWAGSEGWRR